MDILQECPEHETDSFYFKKLDKQNGAAMLAKILLEQCTTLNLFIGTAINPAHQNPGLPSDLSIKLKLIDKLCNLMERLGKRVSKKFTNQVGPAPNKAFNEKTKGVRRQGAPPVLCCKESRGAYAIR